MLMSQVKDIKNGRVIVGDADKEVFSQSGYKVIEREGSGGQTQFILYLPSGRRNDEDFATLRGAKLAIEELTKTKDGALSDLFGGHLDPLFDVTEKEANDAAMKDEVLYSEGKTKISKHEDGVFTLVKNGKYIGEFKTYAEAVKKAEADETTDGGPGSGQKGHTTAEQEIQKRNFLKQQINKKSPYYAKAKENWEYEKAHGATGNEHDWIKRDILFLQEEAKKKISNNDTSDGGEGSGKKGHTTAAKNFAKGLQRHHQETQQAKKKFPVGSQIRENRSGASVAQVTGHSGNIIHTTKGDLHITKATKDSTPLTPEECQKVGEANGVDFSKYNLDQYCMGMNVEQEHNDLTNGDPAMTSKIVIDHLNEIDNYYTLLEKMESQAETKDGGEGSGKKGHVTAEQKAMFQRKKESKGSDFLPGTRREGKYKGYEYRVDSWGSFHVFKNGEKIGKFAGPKTAAKGIEAHIQQAKEK